MTRFATIQLSYLILLAQIIVLFYPRSGAAEREITPYGSFEVIVDHNVLNPGGTLWVALKADLDDGWHLYWRNPGDSGLAPKFEWQLPTGVTAGDIAWPTPSFIAVGPLVNIGYEGKATLAVPLTISSPYTSSSSVLASLHVNLLVCKEDCIPYEHTFSFSFIVRDGMPVRSSSYQELHDTLKALPADPREDIDISATRLTETIRLTIQPRELDYQISSLEFYPQEQGLIKLNAESTPSLIPNGAELILPLDPNSPALSESAQGRLIGVLKVVINRYGAEDETAYRVDIPLAGTGAATDPASPASHTDVSNIVTPASSPSTQHVFSAASLLLAFLGGLILNLMPCVFPILSLKALHILDKGASASRDTRLAGVFFTLGVLTSFWLLAGVLLGLRTGGEHIGWGFQLQSSTFVIVIIGVLFYLSLNLLGVFELGSSLQRLAGDISTKRKFSGAFFNGVLATMIATPCTAPFMGTAIAAALSLGGVHAFAIFTSLALGMAAPFLLLSLSPTLAHLLPRPGAWMETFRNLMAFPLLGTIIWLLWVLSMQRGQQSTFVSLVGLLLAAFGIFILGRSRFFGVTAWRQQLRQILIVGFIALGLIPALQFGNREPAAATAAGTTATISKTDQESSPWLNYSAAALKSNLAAGHPVFIDFTAAWCITCQVNKLTVLQSLDVLESFKEAGVILMRADWTDEDPEISSALEEIGRNGVPVYALYERSGEQPYLFPSLLTKSMVIEKIATLKR